MSEGLGDMDSGSWIETWGGTITDGWGGLSIDQLVGGISDGGATFIEQAVGG